MREKINRTLMRSRNFAAEHKGWTVLADGPAFDCMDETKHDFIQWAKNNGGKKVAWIVAVTHNEGKNFEGLLTNLMEQKIIAEHLDDSVGGLAKGWGIGGFEDEGNLNIDYSVVLLDWPEKFVMNLAKAQSRFIPEQVPQKYVARIDLKTGECSFPEVV